MSAQALDHLRLEGRHDSRGNFIGWTDQDIVTAAATFEALGSPEMAASHLHVPVTQVREWMASPVWDRAIERARAIADESLDRRLTQVMDKAYSETLDRMENGDYTVTKDGLVVRRPIGARDAAWIASVTLDKRKALRSRSRESGRSDEDKLRELARRIAQLATSTPAEEAQDLVDGELLPADDFGDLV